MESIACGTPVIANETSDLSTYLSDGQNGFLVSLGTLHADLERIISGDLSVPVNRSLFDYHAYEPGMRQFLSDVWESGSPGVQPT